MLGVLFDLRLAPTYQFVPERRVWSSRMHHMHDSRPIKEKPCLTCDIVPTVSWNDLWNRKTRHRSG